VDVTDAFAVGPRLPPWPSFIASATFYAADGTDGLARGYPGNAAGIVRAALTLVLVDGPLGGGAVAPSVVGAVTLPASRHEFVPPLSLTPGGFFGYASTFGVHAAETTAVGPTGPPGETTAAILSTFLGAVVGPATDEVSSAVERR
jgi:hypothetical protein